MRIVDGDTLNFKTCKGALTHDEKVEALLQAMEYSDIIKRTAKQLSEEASDMPDPDHQIIFFATSPIYAMGKEVSNILQALLDDMTRPEHIQADEV